MADLPNGKVCVASYHMWRLYPTRITTRFPVRASNHVSTAHPAHYYHTYYGRSQHFCQQFVSSEQHDDTQLRTI